MKQENNQLPKYKKKHYNVLHFIVLENTNSIINRHHFIKSKIDERKSPRKVINLLEAYLCDAQQVIDCLKILNK